MSTFSDWKFSSDEDVKWDNSATLPKNNRSVEIDFNSLTTTEETYGYEGYKSTVTVPLDVVFALLERAGYKVTKED